MYESRVLLPSGRPRLRYLLDNHYVVIVQVCPVPAVLVIARVNPGIDF